MIATNSEIYIDECDPYYETLRNSWEAVSRRVGRTLERVLMGDHMIVSSAEDYPDYRLIKGEITEACRRVNA